MKIPRLNLCPKCDNTLWISYGKYGPFIGCSLITCDFTKSIKINARPLYTINRSGSLVARLQPTNQCGLKGQDTFKFKVRMSMLDLDNKGFVVDNFDINKAMRNLGDYAISRGGSQSCEKLALYALEKLVSLDESRVAEVDLSIIPNNFANIDISWTNLMLGTCTRVFA